MLRQTAHVLSVVAAVMAINVTTTYAKSSTEQAVRKHFASYPVLVSIARCESGFRQFDENGRILKNPNSSATGVMQIMSSVHRHAASRLNYDINTLAGNLGYAKHLYKTEGTRPWNPSRHCWG